MSAVSLRGEETYLGRCSQNCRTVFLADEGEKEPKVVQNQLLFIHSQCCDGRLDVDEWGEGDVHNQCFESLLLSIQRKMECVHCGDKCPFMMRKSSCSEEGLPTSCAVEYTLPLVTHSDRVGRTSTNGSWQLVIRFLIFILVSTRTRIEDVQRVVAREAT